MSSASEGSRDWRFYVTDMIEFAEKARRSEMERRVGLAWRVCPHHHQRRRRGKGRQSGIGP